MTQPPADDSPTDLRSGFVRTPDGIHLYWRAVGRGPVMALCNGVGVGADVFWKYLTAHFRQRATVVLWDYRGHGRSDRGLDPVRTDVSVERHADDLALVLEEVGGGPAVVVGHSMGCQVALETWHRHPDRVRGLVLALGSAGRTLETFFDQPFSLPLIRFLHHLAVALGPLSNHLVRPLIESPVAWFLATRFSLVDPIYAQLEDMRPYMEHLVTLDFRFFTRAVLALQDHDAWPWLHEIDVPVLVIAAENDKFTPMWCSRRIVERVPGAELLVLADASHAALIEQPETIHHRIDRFLAERLGEAPA